ncbi:MAG: hypothetical protein ACLGIR_13030 [Actinomycetes bacterium]
MARTRGTGRLRAVAVLVALGATACGAQTPSGEPTAGATTPPAASASPTPEGGPATEPTPDGTSTPASAPEQAGGGAPGGGSADESSGTGGGQAPGGGGGDGSAGGGGSSGGGSAPGAGAPPARTPVADDGPVGANGRAYVRGERRQLVLEVDVQQGVQADRGALDHLRATVARHATSRTEVGFAGGSTITSSRTEWDVDAIRATAASVRDVRSGDDALGLQVLYLRGGFVQDGQLTDAIGVAVSASVFAVFPERWRGGVGLLGSASAVERAVLVHEYGHLVGLIDLTFTSDRPREDPDHPGHSRDQRSVMFWAIESTAIGQVFSGPPPDTFTADDEADIAGLRDGRL